MSLSLQNRGGLTVTAQQAAVVDHVCDNRVTVVGAGAGSGKTYTTVASVLHLVELGRAELDQFVLITFTNKAADELRGRIELALRGRQQAPTASAEERRRWAEQSERLSAAFVGTIHSFCFRLLRLYGYDLGVARQAEASFARMLREETLRDVLEAYARTKPRSEIQLFGTLETCEEYTFRELLDSIHAEIKNRGLSPAQVEKWTSRQGNDPGQPHRQTVARLVREADSLYAAKKEEHQLLDASDQLLQAARLLETKDKQEVISRIGYRYRYLFIDEFQDTDRTQKRIVDALIPVLQGVLVVGDHKQSIYAFRGADVSLLQQLAEENKVKVLPLNVSRRPTAPFLQLQNTLFTQMGKRYKELSEPLEAYEKTLNPSAGPPPLTLLEADDEAGQIARIAAYIKHLLKQQIDRGGKEPEPIQPGHIVLLVRSNHIASTYADGLRGLDIDARIDTGDPLYARPEIVSTYRLLRLLLYYPDDAVLSLALDTPYLRDVDLRQRERDRIQYEMTGTPLVDTLKERYPSVHEKLKTLRNCVRTDTVSQILGRLYELFKIREYYLGRGDHQAAQNLHRLREVARDLFSEEQALTLRQFVDWLQIAITTRREEEFAEPISEAEPLPDYVRVMTIHRAKGLEFPIVIIPKIQRPLAPKPKAQQNSRNPPFVVRDNWGVEVELPLPGMSGTFSPRYPSIQASQRRALVQEEMRIFYVAITRAQHAVVLAGKKKERPNKPESEWYSWQDEVLEAWPALATVGARRAGAPGT